MSLVSLSASATSHHYYYCQREALSTSRRYYHDAGGHFRADLLGSWIDLDETRLTNGPGKGDPVEFWAESLQWFRLADWNHRTFADMCGFPDNEFIFIQIFVVGSKRRMCFWNVMQLHNGFQGLKAIMQLHYVSKTHEFKVIQGRWFWHQSKARMRPPIGHQ